MRIRHDPDADAVYVTFANEPSEYTQLIDDHRFVDYAGSGAIIGVEFLDVSAGIRVEGLPVRTDTLAEELRRAGLPVLDGVRVEANRFGFGVISMVYRSTSGQIVSERPIAIMQPPIGTTVYGASSLSQAGPFVSSGEIQRVPSTV